MSCLKWQGYLKSKLSIFSKPFLHVISTRHQCSHPTQKFGVLLSSYPPSLSWANIITLTILKSVPFCIPTAVALDQSSASLAFLDSSFYFPWLTRSPLLSLSLTSHLQSLVFTICFSIAKSLLMPLFFFKWPLFLSQLGLTSLVKLLLSFSR